MAESAPPEQVVAEAKVHSPVLSPSEIAKEKLAYIAARIAHHEDAAYRNFNFFVTLTTAIVGGIGYLALLGGRSAEGW